MRQPLQCGQPLGVAERRIFDMAGELFDPHRTFEVSDAHERVLTGSCSTSEVVVADGVVMV